MLAAPVLTNALENIGLRREVAWAEVLIPPPSCMTGDFGHVLTLSFLFCKMGMIIVSIYLTRYYLIRILFNALSKN